MKAYRNSGTYRSRDNYRGNAGKKPKFFARNAIDAPAVQRFKLEEISLPAGRQASRIVSV